MRISLIVATLAATVLLVCPLIYDAQAQPRGGPPQTAGTNAAQYSMNTQRYHMAVVDVSYVFKNYVNFTAKMEQLKVEAEKSKAVLTKEREAIGKEQEKLKLYKPGTREFKETDERIARLDADLRIEVAKQRKDFVEREAHVYYQTYLEVQDAVKNYATKNDIGIVLRSNEEPADPTRRETVLAALRKSVVFQNLIDITPHVLQDLNRSGPPRARLGGTTIPVPRR